MAHSCIYQVNLKLWMYSSCFENHVIKLSWKAIKSKKEIQHSLGEDMKISVLLSLIHVDVLTVLVIFCVFCQ